MKPTRGLSLVVTVLVLIVCVLVAAPSAPAAAWSGGSSAPENIGGVTGEGFRAADGSPLTGKGQLVVVIDGAFNPTHPMLAGRVAEEACFGTFREPYKLIDTTCSRSAMQWNANPEFRFESGPGTSKYNLECVDPDGRICHDFHGTSVAGLAAGAATNVGGVVGAVSGIASEADLALIKVGRRGGWNYSAVEAALQYVRDVLAPKYSIAAVNISADYEEIPISDGESCPVTGFSSLVSELAAKNIAVTVASGNAGLSAGNGQWACAPGAIAVGASGITDMNTLTGYSNASSLTKLLAPVGAPTDSDDLDGVWSAFSYRTPGTAMYENNYNKLWGTSFAAPQVAGAYAVIRQRFPTMSVAEATGLLQRTGVNVQDTREGRFGHVVPRVSLSAAAGSRYPSSPWDFEGDGSAALPVTSTNRNLLSLQIVNQDGDAWQPPIRTIAEGWAIHSFTIPVSDYRNPSTNGFIAARGNDLFYYPYSRVTGRLEQSRLIAPNSVGDAVGGAYVTGLPLPGTGEGVVLQSAAGELKLLLREDNGDMLGHEMQEVLPAEASDNSKLVGVADINQDGKPDLVVRDATSGKVRAYMGTGDPATPFAHRANPVASESWWADKQQVFVVNGWANHPASPCAPWLGYSAPTTLALLAAPLGSDGTLGSSRLVQSGNWAQGIRFLFAARSD